MSTISFNAHFPGYDILGEISRSNARVLKARHIATGDIVAIKHFALNTDADTLRRFERESAIMTQMSHPNIVRVREIRLDADLPYIVMAYIDGGSVRQLITESGGLPVETTIRLGLQMLDAFRVIHAQGIVHRDVKPENILYRTLANGELHFLLTDFGVARLHEQPVTMTGQSLMTYEYAAPEQFDNPRHVEAAADYYALGVVLYECLTGNVPFAMRNETGIATFMNAVLTTPPPAPVLPTNQALPGSLETLLKQLLVKNPAERIRNPDEVKLALKQAELEQLRAEHTQTAPVVPSAGAPARPLPTPPATSRPRQTVRPAVPPVGESAETGSGSTRSRRNRRYALLGIVGIVGLGLAGYWFIPVSDGSSPLAADPLSTTPAAQEPTSATLVTVDPQQQLELARQRYRQQVAEATERLEATTSGGKTGLFGGVKGLSVRLENPSPVAFQQVAVKVLYIKENGQLFKSSVMYFNDVGPGASLTRQAPDSQRGVRFSAQVLRADAEVPDSLTVSPTL